MPLLNARWTLLQRSFNIKNGSREQLCDSDGSLLGAIRGRGLAMTAAGADVG
jgi:hypothetical protein